MFAGFADAKSLAEMLMRYVWCSGWVTIEECVWVGPLVVVDFCSHSPPQ